MDTTQQPVAQTTTAAHGIFGTKVPSGVAFAVGILLFFLPFSEIKCNKSVMLNKSGLGFVIGQDWKVVNNLGFGGKDNSENMTNKTKTEGESNAQYFAIAALGLGVLGLLLSFADAKLGGTAGVVTGILSAGALIGMMVTIKNWFNDSLAKEAVNKAQEGDDNLGLNKIGNSIKDNFTLDFTPWFYVSVVVFLAAAFFCYKRLQSTK